MADEGKEPGGGDGRDLLPSTEKAYGGTKLPHKFCPYCGHRNEATAENCANCGKDISWMRVPEPSNPTYNPPVKPKPMGKVFSRRTMVIIAIIIVLVVAAIVLAITLSNNNSNKSKPNGVLRVEVVMLDAGASSFEAALGETDSLAAEPPAAAGVVVHPRLVAHALDVELVDEGALPPFA